MGAEVVVEKDSVTVRPTGTGKATQVEKILQQICFDDGSGMNKWVSGGDTCVICVGDFLMRDEDVYTALKNFFEPESTGDSPAPESVFLDFMDQMQLPKKSDAINLEANSMSLGRGFNFAARYGLGDPNGAEAEGGTGGIPKETSSEPDLQVADPIATNETCAGAPEADRHNNDPTIFNCT